jgi:hypothetical protein
LSCYDVPTPHRRSAFLTSFFTARDGGDQGIQEILTRIFADDLACTMERLPYRAMEVRWVNLNPA